MPKFDQESFLMRFFRRIGQDSYAWPLRRLHCPVPKGALVLEVGSGGNPYFRSNVLLDAYEETQERHWVPLVSDRPTVLGFVEHLPFRDKAFDFVIASHVLEHSTDPARFLLELQRVAKAGYIEVPDAFMERLNPYRDHRLEVTVRGEKLVIRKKPDWQCDPELVELYEHRAKAIFTQETIPRNPFDFHVRFYWENQINFEVLNDQVLLDWVSPSGEQRAVQKLGMRQLFQKLARNLLTQKKRNRSIDFMGLLACPTCGCDHLRKDAEAIVCMRCSVSYPIKQGIPIMYCLAPKK